MADEILTEKRGDALLVTFNRPERGNSLNTYMADRFCHAIKPVALDHSIRAVMLRGAGGNFVDGLETKAYGGDVDKLTGDYSQIFPSYHAAIRELRAMNKPVLAVVEGSVAGPGLSLMMACDLVLAARTTKFNCRYTTYGVTPDGGLSLYLTRNVGALKAAELLMLNETFDADQAARWNLVNKVVDDERLTEESLSWIDRLVTGPTKAFGHIKMLLAKSFEQGLASHLSLEYTCWQTCVKSFDFREAVKAQAAGRPAKFSGA